MDARGVGRQLERVVTRVNAMLSRATLSRVDDSTPIQTVQLELLGQARSEVERFQEYGFSSHPKPGDTDLVVAAIGGNQDNLIVIAAGDRSYRLKGALGEVGLYDDLGKVIHLKQDGTIEIAAGSGGKVEVTGDEIALTAAVSVTIDAPLVDIQGKGDHKVHTHNDVTPGGSITGPVT